MSHLLRGCRWAYNSVSSSLEVILLQDTPVLDLSHEEEPHCSVDGRCTLWAMEAPAASPSKLSPGVGGICPTCVLINEDSTSMQCCLLLPYVGMLPTPSTYPSLLSVLCLLKRRCLNPPGNRMFVGRFLELGWELWFMTVRSSRVCIFLGYWVI